MGALEREIRVNAAAAAAQALVGVKGSDESSPLAAEQVAEAA